MIQLKQQIIDGDSRDRKAIIDLDLQSAFDTVKHSEIMRQISRLNMGEKTYNYTRDFISNRRAKVRAGDLKMDEKNIGSTGTPQGSDISPMIFNLVMIQVAEKLNHIEGVEHTLYADDITPWICGGSDAYIEATKQTAIDAMEDCLEGTGLQCSPRKFELLLYLPSNRYHRKRMRREPEKIHIRTVAGMVIPRVNRIRVLGMIVEDN